MKTQQCEWCAANATMKFISDEYKPVLRYRFACSDETHRNKVRRLMSLDGFDRWREVTTSNSEIVNRKNSRGDL